AGASIRQAQKSLSMAIQRLTPDDHFNVIEFNSRTHALFQTPLPATPSRISAAISWVERLNADGGTEMLPALHKAFKGSGSPSHLRQVIFLTDGAIGNEEALFNAIHLHREDARVFTVGIGAAPNSYFMVRAAEIGQGSFTHIGDIHEVSDRMEDLFRKLENPLVTDLKLTWPEGVNVEAWPNPLPDIYDGEPLVVAARADDAAGEVQVTGISSLQPWQVALPLAQASTRSGISKHWARQKMASLELARHRMPQDTLVFEKNILQTALTHGLVSRLTSLVAVDITPSRPQDMSLESQILPLNLPEGWDFDKVFGEDISSAPLSPLNTDILKEASTIAVGTDRDLSQTERGLILPQTATLFEIKALLALLLMIFSSLSLWRLSKSHCSRSI
ncbi:MAG: VWA domain-containing protein, partial [Pseudomonadota bacterium]